MAHVDIEREDAKRRQVAVFQAACNPRKYNMTLIGIAGLSGIPYSTLRTYAGHNGETVEMPTSALWHLAGVLPDELLAVLLPPIGGGE